MEKLLDIIIPAYNCKDTLNRTLASIAMQTIVSRIQVTIVNDKSLDGSYKQMIKQFNKIMDIQELILEKNSGPGVARQVGIDNTKAPFIYFLDADDTLCNAFALQTLLNNMIESEACFVYGDYYVETEDGFLIDNDMETDMRYGLHGKIYRREFLDKYNIRFNESYINEDLEFQVKVISIIDAYKLQSLHFNDKVMVYHYTPKSLTNEMSIKKTAVTWIQAVVNIGDFMNKWHINNDLFIRKSFVNMYNNYNYLIYVQDKTLQDQSFELIKQFYIKQVKPLQVKFEEWNSSFGNGLIYGTCPMITFNDFLCLMEE